MVNILFIPPDKPDDVKFIVDIAKEIKNRSSDTYLSSLVTLTTYDLYYKCGCIDSFIIEPGSVLKRLVLFEPGHFDLALIFRKNPIWAVACLKAKVKTRLYFPLKNLAQKKELMTAQILKILSENNWNNISED